MASALTTVTDGVSSGQSLTASSSNALVTPGATVTIALTSSSGVVRWRLYQSQTYLSPHPPVAPLNYEIGATGPFQVTFTAPPYPCTLQLRSEVSDGNNPSYSDFTMQVSPGRVGYGSTYLVRGIVDANVANLASFTVAGNDGLTYVQGERLLLVSQTTAAQNGVYVVGVVAAGTAPLTRAPDMPAGATIYGGTIVEASEGTRWFSSSWKATATGAIVIGTNDPVFYPRVDMGLVTLSGGAGSTSTSWWKSGSRITAVDVTAANAVRAALNVAGKGNGSTVFAGTTTDQINYVITNW